MNALRSDQPHSLPAQRDGKPRPFPVWEFFLLQLPPHRLLPPLLTLQILLCRLTVFRQPGIPGIDSTNLVERWVIGLVKHLLKATLLGVNVRAIDGLKFVILQRWIKSMFSLTPSQIVRSTGTHDLAGGGVTKDVGAPLGLRCGLGCVWSSGFVPSARSSRQHRVDLPADADNRASHDAELGGQDRCHGWRDH